MFIGLRDLEARTTAGRPHAGAPHWCLSKTWIHDQNGGGWTVLLWMQCGGVRLPDSLSESPNKPVIYTVYKISFKMSINPSN